MEYQGMKIFILGLGKVGVQLAKSLTHSPFQVIGAYNRSEKSFDVPSGLPLYFDEKEIPVDADVYLVCVSDDAVKTVADQLPAEIKRSKIIAHTSGVHTLEVFGNDIQKPGVFYPLNTFAEAQEIIWAETPFYLSGSTDDTINTLDNIARKISNKVFTISDKQKRALHLSAVFVNNFPTHLFQLADTLLKENEMEFEHLLPLIRTMVDNVESKDIHQILTGPAIRGDQETINQHLQLLENKSEIKEIYQKITKSINKDLTV